MNTKLIELIRNWLGRPDLTRVSPRVLAVLVTFALLAIYLFQIDNAGSLFSTIERKTYDMRLLSEGSRNPGNDIVIAAIDEKALSEVGRWPWSRGTLARLVRKLDRLGAKVIVFDVFFPESENREMLSLIRQFEADFPHIPSSKAYRKIKQRLNADSTLAATIKKSGKVVLSMAFLTERSESGHISEKQNDQKFNAIRDQAIQVIKDYGDGSLSFPMPQDPVGVDINVGAIQRAANYSGHIDIFPDADGTSRWSPTVIRWRGRYFPSGDVQAVRAYRGYDQLMLVTDNYGILGLQLDDYFIPTDQTGRVLIHYYGPQNTFPTISIADILKGNVKAETVRNKIVLIGATAVGIGDIRVTPYSSTFPGPEIRANVMQNLLDGDFIQRPDWMSMVDILVLLVLGLSLSFLLPRLSVSLGGFVVVGLFVLYIGFAVWLFNELQIWLNVTFPSLLLLSLFVATTINNYLQSEHQKRQIKGAFQHYVAATVVDQIIDNIDQLQLGGEKRELSVLFSDIRGFTTLSENIEPEEMVRLLNNYLTRMTEQVFQHQGTLDKYIGDAIMAFYGAPVRLDDHAVLACRTALDMMRELHILQSQWTQEDKPVLDIGIGINTGPMIVGNMGSESRFDYTVIGDAVNLGSRIESMNKIYGTNILISEFTYEHVRDKFDHLRKIDVAPVRGRQEPVGIYEMILSHNYDDLDWLPEFDRAYKLFGNNEIKKAKDIFEKLVVETADPVSQYYMMRCQNPRRRSGD
ncbi:MAG: adenylate/guanylate cyclase domain-containing protein [Acidiferrobacterales bacterium]